jgi:hypothetical protein
VTDLDTNLVDDGIDGPHHGSGESQEIGQEGNPLRCRGVSRPKISRGDDKDPGGHEDNSHDSDRGKDFSNEQNRPDLRKERRSTGDGINEGEIPHPIPFNQANQIDGLDQSRDDAQKPELGRRLGKEERKGIETQKKWEIEEGAHEKDPEKEFDGPISLLGDEIPGRMD